VKPSSGPFGYGDGGGFFRLMADVLRQVHTMAQLGSGMQKHALPVRHLRNLPMQSQEQPFHQMANLLHLVRTGSP
jgi:hypothetical protein